MPAQIVPLTANPNQTIQVTLNIDGGKIIPLIVVARYQEMASYWVLTISDKNGNLIIDSLPLTAGLWPAANIMPPALGIGSWFAIDVSGTGAAAPNSTNLGVDWLVLVDDTPIIP